MPAARTQTASYVGIGLVTGLFSALFGVGGGIVVVPLLITLFAFEAKVATGTSLAAIGFTTLFGVISYSILGRIAWEEVAVLSVPAVAGVLAGTWLQQRISSRHLVFLFAALLMGIAVRLLLQ